MKYKNTKTRAIINSPCKITGGDWIEIKEVEEIVKEAPEEVKEEIEEEVEDEEFDGVTVKQIKQELDAMGIEYDPRAKKQELYDLMIGK